jgi:uncharacterized protein HemX
MAEEVQNTTQEVQAAEPAVTAPPPEPPKTSSRNMLVLFSLVLIFAVILLAAGGYVYLLSKNKSASNSMYTQAVPTAVPTQAPSPTGVTSVNNSSDLNSALKEVNGTSETDLQNDLNQANSEGNNL